VGGTRESCELWIDVWVHGQVFLFAVSMFLFLACIDAQCCYESRSVWSLKAEKGGHKWKRKGKRSEGLFLLVAFRSGGSADLTKKKRESGGGGCEGKSSQQSLTTFKSTSRENGVK